MTVGRMDTSGFIQKESSDCSPSDHDNICNIGFISSSKSDSFGELAEDGEDRASELLFKDFDINELVNEVQRPYGYGKGLSECGLFPIEMKTPEQKGIPTDMLGSLPQLYIKSGIEDVFPGGMKIIIKPSCFYFTGFQRCNSPICLQCVARRMEGHKEFAQFGMIGARHEKRSLYFPTFTMERTNDIVSQVKQTSSGWKAVTRAVRKFYQLDPMKRLKRLKKEAYLRSYFEENLRVRKGELWKARREIVAFQSEGKTREEIKRLKKETKVPEIGIVDWMEALELSLIEDGREEEEARTILIRKCKSLYRKQLKEMYKNDPVESVRLHSTRLAKEDMRDLNKAANEASILTKEEKACFDCVEYLGYLDTTFKHNPAEGIYHCHIHAVFAIREEKVDLEKFKKIVLDAWCGATTGSRIAQLVKMVDEEEEEDGNNLGKFSKYITKFNGMAYELANGMRKEGIAKDSMSLIGLMQYAVDMDSDWAKETYHNYTKAWSQKQQYWPSNGWKKLVSVGMSLEEDEEDCDSEEEEEKVEIDIPEGWHKAVAAQKHKIGVTLKWNIYGRRDDRCLDRFLKLLVFEVYDYKMMTVRQYCDDKLKTWLEDFYPEDMHQQWKMRRIKQKQQRLNQYLGQ